MAFRCIFAINGANYGVKETWFLPGGSAQNAIEKMSAVVKPRSLLLGKSAAVVGLTARDTTVVNASQFSAVNPADNPVGTDTIDTPWSALSYRATSGGANTRNVWVRMVPDDYLVWNAAGSASPSPLAKRLLLAFNNTLSVNGFGWFGLLRGGVNAPQNVSGVGVDGAGRLTITTVAPGPWAPQTQVLVSGVRGTNMKQSFPGRSGVNGLHYILSVTGNTMTLDLFISTLPGAPVWNHGGKVANRSMQFYLCDFQDLETFPRVNISERRPGQTNFATRGRAKVSFRNTNS